MKRRLFSQLLPLALLPWGVNKVHAAHPIRVLNVGVPGGALDTVLRSLLLHGKVDAVVENLPGGNGSVMLNRYAGSADPRTYAYATSGVVAGSGFMKGINLRLDPLKDLQPLALVSLSPFCMLTKKAGPLQTVKDLQKYKGQLLHGSLGNNSADTMAGLSFLKELGLNVKHVSYVSIFDAYRDLNNGQLDIVTGGVGSSASYLDSGQLTVVVSLSEHKSDPHKHLRAPLFLNKPFNVSGWQGLFKLKSALSADDNHLVEQIKLTCQNKDFVQKMTAGGHVIQYEDSATFAARIQSDVQRYERFFKDL